MKPVVFIFLFLYGFISSAQQSHLVDFKTAEGTIRLSPKEKTVAGELTYDFKVLKNTDTLHLDANNAKAVLAEDSPTRARIESTRNKILFIFPFKAGETYRIRFSYRVKAPKKALYFVGWNNKGTNQIWSQGQGQDHSHWLPVINDVNDKIIFNLTFNVPEGYKAISNGQLITHHTEAQREIWQYQMSKPISSYLIAVVVGKYLQYDLQSTNGTPVHLYYEEKDTDKFKWTYQYTKELFDFLEKEIGVPYPFENYKQIPVRDFMHGGMENATATVFAENLMTDSIGFADQNYVNVNAHELAHQWFGNLVTQKSEADHWLQEGFASYYALLAEKNIFGEDDFYFSLYQSAEKLKAQSDVGKGQSLLNPKADALTFYEKGAWALHILHKQLGEDAFKKGIRNYLQKYACKNVSVNDFIEEMQKASGRDLSGFVADWLQQSAFQDDQALEALKESPFMQSYMPVAGLRNTPLTNKQQQLSRALDFPVNKYTGQEVVYQLADEADTPVRNRLYQKAFQTRDLYIRQAVAETLQKIPKDLQTDYESLLSDPSYLTRELALLHLWQNFPAKRHAYLDQLAQTQGFYYKNIRMLWLTLSLVTADYQTDKKQDFYNELSGYTHPAYDYSIQQNAFGYLYQINRFSYQNYKDLIQAAQHPVWRFKNFARELLKELLKEDLHQTALENLKPQLTAEEQALIDKYTAESHIPQK